MSGLRYKRDPDTCGGTIEPHPEVPVPGSAKVGRTSAKKAWLAVGPEVGAVRGLVTALHQAKG